MGYLSLEHQLVGAVGSARDSGRLHTLRGGEAVLGGQRVQGVKKGLSAGAGGPGFGKTRQRTDGRSSGRLPGGRRALQRWLGRTAGGLLAQDLALAYSAEAVWSRPRRQPERRMQDGLQPGGLGGADGSVVGPGRCWGPGACSRAGRTCSGHL